VAGLVGFSFARAGVIKLWEPVASRVPGTKHSLFLADAFAHGTAYLAGAGGALLVCYWARQERRRRSKETKPLL
jgi:hypothetical protein